MFNNLELKPMAEVSVGCYISFFPQPFFARPLAAAGLN